MNTITTPVEPSLNQIAPTVFIESIDLEKINNKDVVIINLSFENDDSNWLNNQSVLNNTHVFISSSNGITKNTLINVKNSGVVKSNSLYGSITIEDPMTSAFSVVAYCGNEYFSGTSTFERVRNVDPVLTSSIAPAEFPSDVSLKKFKYINKIKDFKILSLDEISIEKITDTSVTEEIKPINISYATNKTAKFGTIIDIEKILLKRSPAFNILKRYPIFKKQILNRTNILLDKTFFSKINLTENKKEFIKINNPIKILKMDDNSNSFYLSSFEKSNGPDDYSEYGLSLKLCVQDYSYEIYNNVKKSILEAKSLVKELKNNLIEYSKNENIANVNEYLFKNNFNDAKKLEIERAINTLLITARFFKPTVTDDQFLSLFVSCLHPLTTSIKNIEKIDSFLMNVEKIFRSIFLETGAFLQTSNLEKYSLIEIEKEFSYIDFLTNQKKYQSLDFNYRKNYGFEVFFSETLEQRNTEVVDGIREITIQESDTKNIQEVTKYFGIAPSRLSADLNTFSVSTIDLGEKFYFLSTVTQVTNELSDEIYNKIKEYNDYSFSYDNLHSSYFQLAANDVYIKSLSNKKNVSSNSKVVNTIFDSNEDSKGNSIKSIQDAKIIQLNNFIDKNNAKKPPPDTAQGRSFAGEGTQSGRLAFTNEQLADPVNKARIILLYNCLFIKNILFTGNNYDLCELVSKETNEIFNKNYKLFNQYFIIKKKEPAPISSVLFVRLTDDLNFNIQPKYINRRTVPGGFSINVETI